MDNKKILILAAVLYLVAVIGTFSGLHLYRFYMNQFVGFCVNSSAECMVPIIG